MTKKHDPALIYGHLLQRASTKIAPQKNPSDILPPKDIDFAPYFQEIIPKDMPKPDVDGRHNLEKHYQRLRFLARGKPEIIAFNMLLISFNRRDTKYNNLAYQLFERLWQDHIEELLEIIPTRDLISSFRVFADRSEDDKRRLLGKLAFLYGHLIKIYESERIIEGRKPDQAGYSIPQKVPRLGFERLWGVMFGGDNSFEIVHVLLAEEIREDETLGLMILELITRFQAGHTVFSRMDQGRIAAGYKIDSEREWSFGFNPSKPLDEEDGDA